MRPPSSPLARRLAPPLALLGALAACDEGPPQGPRYYERVIQPILTASCVRNQGSCHKDDGTGNALGNLDLTSYEAVTKRGDVLRTYGSYPVPLLLLKSSGAQVPPIPYQVPGGQTVLLPSQIEHAGGATISVDSTAFYELQQWMANGATRDGSLRVTPQQMGTGGCRADFAKARPDVTGQLASVDVQSAAFRHFAEQVEPILAQSCAFANCHSSEQSDFFLTCKGSGQDDATKFNFLAAQAFVAQNADASQLLLKPLSPTAGGVSHTGGVFYADKGDPNWKKISDWAREAGASPILANISEGQRFFDEHVMPVFLQRGCALEACHSPGAANDFKLRAGSRGFFSPYSIAANYRFARHDFLVPEVPDVRQSRLVKKPIVSSAEGGLGIVHRGGPPLQTPGEALDPAACPQPWPGDGKSSAFCTLVEWHRIERAELLAKGEADPMAQGDTLPLVAVARPAHADRLIDFDTYRPGADLLLSRVAVGAGGAVDPSSATAPTSLLDNCAGVAADRANVDVRGPDASYDGARVAFAMRLSAQGSLDLYEVTLDAARTCTKLTDGNGQSKNGILLHNLDPMYAPNGALVFASTRGRPAVGPTRSLKYLLPQTDLWRMARQGAGYGPPEQMTALLGSELSPAMMLDGRVTFTAEKASADFYQLSGRRMNWDLTDYHPLLAQRATSPGKDGMVHASAGYGQATEIREALDRDFVFILSDDGAKGGGGALALFNRSIGPFSPDRSDITFLKALTIVDPQATGRAGPTRGAYRSPFPLPDGKILVSYAPEVSDLGAATQVRYDLVVIDPITGARTPVAGFQGGRSYLEPVLVFKREPRTLFNNLTQLVFGGHADPASDPTHGAVHYPDLPMLATLLGANLRTGRFVDTLRPARKVAIYEDQAPPADLAQAMAGQTGMQRVFQNRKLLGVADLASDGSVQVRLPALTPLVVELQDGAGKPLFIMTEEDQVGPGEYISRGVPEAFFDSVCGGCHGSVSGRELDVAIQPDALTGASVSLSRDLARRVNVGN